MNNAQQIQTERLFLRPVAVSDAPFMLELLNDEAFMQFIGDRGVRDLSQSISYLTDLLERQSGTVNSLLVVQTKSEPNTPMGITSFLTRDELDDPDIGFAFLPKHRGHGYAFEATEATLEYVRKTHSIQRVVAIASPDNQPSIAMLKKLGYRREGEIQLGSCADNCSALFVPDKDQLHH